MISWLQDKLQKHLKKVFIVLLAIIIISFVFTIGNVPGLGGAERELPKREFYTINLNNPKEVEPYQITSMLSFILDYGMPPYNENQFTYLILFRIYALDLAKRLSFPSPTKDQLADYIKTKRLFQDESGKYEPNNYKNFLETIEASDKMSKALLAQTLDQDYKIDQLRKVMAGPGYVLPEEAVLMLQALDTSFSGVLASYDFSQLKSTAVPTDEQLKKYFEKNTPYFEIEPMVSVAYALFKSEDFQKNVSSPSEEELKSYFESNKNQFVQAEALKKAEADKAQANKDKKSASSTPATTDYQEITLASVKEEVLKAYYQEKAQILAAKAAQELTLELFNKHIKKDSEELNSLLQAKGLKLISVPPFGHANMPNLGQDIDPLTLEMAFSLSNDNYFSDVFLVPNGAAVLFFQKEVPSHIPAYEEVKEDVKSVFLETETDRLKAEKANAIDFDLHENSSMTGNAFTAQAKELGCKTSSFEAITVKNIPEEIPNQMLAYLTKLKPTEVSPMIRLKDKGYLVYLSQKTIPTPEQVKPEVEKSMISFRALAANMQFQSMVNDALSILEKSKEE